MVDGSLDKRHEQRVRVEHGRGVFRVELRRHEVGVIGDFHHFDQLALGVHPRGLHARLLKSLEVRVVEFVAVAMAL